MTDETIVAVYDTATQAQAAVASLRSDGIPDSAISLHADTARATGTAPVREQGFWSGLFGGEPDHDTSVYDRSLQSGSTVVTVRVPEAHIARVMETLESHNPVDIDDRATSYGVAGAPVVAERPVVTDRPAVTAQGNETLRLAEEQLSVGKRVVNRGGTRVRRYVVETPVEENVTLHSEQVTLERRPVTDASVAADSFSDKTIELMETAEEAVVSKTAHVYEEVALRKEATEHVETVRDSVRKEEVEVEQIPGRTETTTTRNARI
jgi:uncharacterized protein (TIGR02271 family)